ncbi:MAG: CotH kinase family protein [Muribaculaceae bacterium]|nr:CotH kinase family protein [Muribaculaceae bacterium]
MKTYSEIIKVALMMICLICMSSNAAFSAERMVPAIYITMDDPSTEIDRETYIPATYYVDARGAEGVENVGSKEHPLPLQFRGRGNWTWVGYDKKPYRLLLNDPAPMAGLKSSDYFGLHAHADDNLGFMRNTLGFELARRLGIDWTPSHAPVELYLNGEYRGLYFCTELVRADNDRVDLRDPSNPASDDIDGGWLIEIDNYDTDPHIVVTEGNGQKIIFSHKTPLNLTESQEEFLRSQMTAIDKAIYDPDKSVAKWAELVDIDRLARFYIVQELMDNTESFHGSCFMHRPKGEDAKWMFGPVWDFGSSFFRGSGKFIWQDSNYTLTWIKEICTFPEFQQKVKDIWAEFCISGYDGIEEFLLAEKDRIKAAAGRDFERWPDYGNSDMDGAVEKICYMLGNKARWLGKQWGAIPSTAPDNVEVFLRGTFNTWNTSSMFMPQDDGTYRISLPSLTDEFKIASADFSTVNFGGDGVTQFKANTLYHLVSGVGGKNISVYGEIKDATLIFDPVEQTLYAEGTQIEPVEETLPAFYFRGDLNTWATDTEFKEDSSGLYVVDLPLLTGRFKIADAKFKVINFGGDNITLVEPGVPYKLIQGGKNISLARDIKNAHLAVDLDKKILVVTEGSASGVKDVAADGADNISSRRYFNMQGIELDRNDIRPGEIVIVVESDGSARKEIRK